MREGVREPRGNATGAERFKLKRAAPSALVELQGNYLFLAGFFLAGFLVGGRLRPPLPPPGSPVPLPGGRGVPLASIVDGNIMFVFSFCVN